MSDIQPKSVEEHDFFYYKFDDFRSCRKCGCIENTKKQTKCAGVVKVELRNKSVEDYVTDFENLTTPDHE